MDSLNQASGNINKFLTFKDIVLFFRKFRKSYLASGVLVFGITLCTTAVFLYKTYKDVPKYEAELSFMVNEDNGSSPISGLLGQFGGLLGSGSQMSLQKILELSRTMRITKEVFFTEEEWNGKNDLVANHYINDLKEHHLWFPKSIFTKPSPLENFNFPSTIHLDSLDRTQSLALKALYEKFQEDLSNDANEKTGIMKLKFKCADETLSAMILNLMFERMGQFYVGKTIEKQKETFDNLKTKVDSIKKLMESKDYGLANLKDSYRSSWLYSEDVPKTILDRDIRMLSIVYGEVVKNMEIASFSLDNKTPFIQAIDKPLLPLKKLEQKYLKNIIFGLLTGLLLSAFTVLATMYYKSEMANS